MFGCIVRPHLPDDVYNDGERDNVQNAQMAAVITGWIGAILPIIAVLLQQKVPTPIKYFISLYYCAAGKTGAAKQHNEPVDSIADGS